MEINFLTRKQHRLFNSEVELRREYGTRIGVTIMRRLEFMAAAQCLEEIPHTPPYRRHELTGNRKGQLAVDLGHPHRLVFEPDHDPVPTKAAGGLDLRRITAITILEVEDYH